MLEKILDTSPFKKEVSPWKLTFAIGVGLIILFLVAGLSVGIYRANMAGNSLFSNEAPPPVKDWVAEHSETVAFQPGQSITGFSVNTPGAPARVRVDITAASPVTVAYFDSRFDDQVRENPRTVMMEGHSACLRSGVLRATVECELPAAGSYTLLILDERTLQSTLIAGAGAAIFGVKGPAEQAMTRNDVSLSLSSYRCVKNCRSY
jgi:hypothetical protein